MTSLDETYLDRLECASIKRVRCYDKNNDLVFNFGMQCFEQEKYNVFYLTQTTTVTFRTLNVFLIITPTNDAIIKKVLRRSTTTNQNASRSDPDDIR